MQLTGMDQQLLVVEQWMAGATAGSNLASFTTNDNLYYYNTSGTSVLDGIDDFQGLWLDDGDGTFEDSTKASITGSVLDFSSPIAFNNTVDETLSIQYSYMNGVSGVITTTKTLDLTSGTDSYANITDLVAALHTAIGTAGFSTVTDFDVSESTGALKFETINKGYGVALSVTGGLARTKLGLDTVTTVSSANTLIYQTGAGVSIGSTGAEFTGTGQGLGYQDSGVAGYYPGDDIFIDQGGSGRKYSLTADALILDTSVPAITTSFTGTNVADTAGWVKQNNSTYAVGHVFSLKILLVS